MAYENKKMTAPNLSAATDREQPVILNNSIIPDSGENDNPFEDDWESIFLQMQQATDPAYIHTISLNELYEQVYASRPPLIDGLLCSGTYLFVGAPKMGKSFLMAQLAYHVSLGRTLWGYNVRQGTVLYLALEDEYRRLQERLFRMFGVEGTDELHFATSVKQLGGGLQEQLDRFVRDHPNTKLIIIDTLQKVRENGGDRYSYANDYDIVGQLKNFADQRGICLLLVHHTRKQQADDKFDMISGTNGLLGAADGAFMLQKEKRTGNAATLDVSGRDQQDQKLHLVRNPEKLIWELESVETELWKEPADPILEAVAKMMTDQSWTGTPSQLVGDLGFDIQPNTLSKRLNVKASQLENEYGIHYESKRTHAGRRIILNRISKEA